MQQQEAAESGLEQPPACSASAVHFPLLPEREVQKQTAEGMLQYAATCPAFEATEDSRAYKQQMTRELAQDLVEQA
eukprot:2529542-Rhodomonas_salina.2